MSTGGKKIYHARLDDGERALLQGIVDGGKGSVTRRRRAHILLLADASRDGGGRDDADIADVLGAGASTVERARKRFVLDGLEAALERKEQASSRRPVLDGGGQARPAMLACSDLPEGHARRSLRLPGDRLGGLEVVDSIPEETVRQGLL